MSYAMRSVIILGAVGVFALGYFLFTHNAEAPSESSSDTATTTEEATGGNTASGGGASLDDDSVNTELDSDAVTFTTFVEDKNVPYPNIDRETVFASALVELKELTADNFKTVRENLHNEPYSLNDWFDLAILYKTVDDFDGAKEIWEYLTLASPSNSVAFNNLGNLYHFYLKDFPKAEKYMLGAIKRANDPSYFINLFELYKLSYKKDTNLAEEALLDGLKLNKGNINILMALARHYEDLGETAKAVERYKEAKTHAALIGDTALVDMINTSINRLEN